VTTEAPPRYLALAGPTASGKTAAAMAIAQQHAVEIISVDSALVYRGMDIGTAKPSHGELAAVPHHLIDIRDPLHAYSAAEFACDARSLIEDITARGKLALLVGGTMLYFKALMEGLDAMPKADQKVRAELEREASERGWPAMHAELALVDPITAARLKPTDAQRISRALEVFRLTGQALSSFHTANSNAAQTATVADDRLLISLEPLERSWLHQRIAQRFDAMLADGLIDEVKTLRARGDLHPDLPAMRCVGYRQVWAYLEANETRPLSNTSALHELLEKGIFATRQLAKRQLTWLRSMPERHVVACDAPDALDQVLTLASTFANGRA
jgi:tRNA dimethylallyltransferase